MQESLRERPVDEIERQGDEAIYLSRLGAPLQLELRQP